MDWFISNIGTIVVAVIVFGVVGLIIAKHFINKRKGKSTCLSGCANCPMKGKCH